MLAIRDYLEGKSRIIWDWNGTLLDDFDLCLDAIGGILESCGMPRLSASQYRDHFGFPIRDYYGRLGFDFSKTPFETLSRQFVDHHDRGVFECRLFEGARELLHSLKGEGISHSILSAAKEDQLRAQVRHFGIEEYFDHVYGLGDHYAVSKIERGRQLLEASGISPKATLLIGDTDHDLAVGEALGVEVLLLPDGHQCPKRHERRIQELLSEAPSALRHQVGSRFR